jgi:hypothetical protein
MKMQITQPDTKLENKETKKLRLSKETIRRLTVAKSDSEMPAGKFTSDGSPCCSDLGC